jgi:shikimate kinase
MKLQEIIETKEDKIFCKIEEKWILELLPLKNCIFAPGGSVIYSKKLMTNLRKNSFIIFLDEPLITLEK